LIIFKLDSYILFKLKGYVLYFKEPKTTIYTCTCLCVDAMLACGLCLINIKVLLSESAVSCLLRVRSVSFTSRAKECTKFVPHSRLVSLSHKVGVFLVETSHHFISIRLYFILTILIREDDHNHIFILTIATQLVFCHIQHSIEKLERGRNWHDHVYA
jgi:hypothetical protein